MLTYSPCKKLAGLFFIALFVISSPVLGQQCFNLLPGLKSQDDYEFRELTFQKLSNEEHALIETFFENIADTRWEGKATNINCVGTEYTPKPRKREGILKARIDDERNNNIKIKVIIKNKYSGITEREIVRFYITKDYLKKDSQSSLGKIKITGITPDTISFRKSFILRDKGIQRRDNFYTLAHLGDKLIFEQVYYLQGMYVGEDVWQMKLK